MNRPLAMQSAFTTIELLIVVAIIGILAAIALPQYHEYSVRSKVTECLNFTVPAKLVVSERHAAESSGEFSFTQTRYCADVRVAANGTIVLTTQNTGAAEQPVLQLVPRIVGGSSAAPLRWECQYVAGRPMHVPASCRKRGVPVPADSAASSGGGGGASPPAGGAGADPGTGEPADPGSGGAGGDATTDEGADAAPDSGAGTAGDSGSGAAGGGGGDSSGGGAGGDNSGGGGSTGGSAGSDSSSGGGAPGGGASGDSSAGGGSTGGGTGGDSSAGGGSTGAGTDNGGSNSGGGAAAPPDQAGELGGAKAEETPPEPAKCPHLLPNGKPHPVRCKNWGK